MSVELFVFWSGADKPKKAQEWREALDSYLNKETDVVNLRDGERREDAPWIGVPFILVGNSDEVKHYLDHLTQESQRVLADHAYYWILSDKDHDSLGRNLSVIPQDRIVVLNWNYKHQNVIRSQLDGLLKYPRLAGLSRGMSRVRTEIERVAAGDKGPWTPTLILGESGTGKEEVAQTLYGSIDHQKSGKKKDGFKPLACGSFVETLLQAQLFGIGPRIVPEARERPGLLEVCSDGAVFLDDFEAAPIGVQGALLRVLDTPKNQPAIVFRIGEEDVEGKERLTRVWLIFSTNADIEKLLRENKLREDFIFRLEDRVIHIPPLRERPGDIPAIAHRIWTELWSEYEGDKRKLSAIVLQWLFTRKTRWEGNVRALRALLSLATSMAKLPVHKVRSLRQILGEIMDRGPEYLDWVGIVATFTGPLPPGNPVVRRVLDLDKDADCHGPTKRQTPPPRTPSEKIARESCLTKEGQRQFDQAVKKAPLTLRSNLVRESVRLARIIVYLHWEQDKRIDRGICAELSPKRLLKDVSAKKEISATTADKDLNLLKDVGLLLVPNKETKKQGYQEKTVYEPVPDMFT